MLPSLLLLMDLLVVTRGHLHNWNSGILLSTKVCTVSKVCCVYCAITAGEGSVPDSGQWHQDALAAPAGHQDELPRRRSSVHCQHRQGGHL